MGIWDRFGRKSDEQAAADTQAIERYRYMLRTAPPEAIEQAHAEAFARLTPEQRRMVLEELKGEMPEVERTAAARDGDSPGELARLATRAEIRRPGAMERIFGGVGTSPAWSGAAPATAGLGSMLAGGFLASMAGSVLGSMVAQHFFNSHPEAHHLFGGGDPSFGQLDSGAGLDDSGDPLIDAIDDDPGFDSGGGDTFDV
jgi:hypothetical protein